jgi:hypothetical protein
MIKNQVIEKFVSDDFDELLTAIRSFVMRNSNLNVRIVIEEDFDKFTATCDGAEVAIQE